MDLSEEMALNLSNIFSNYILIVNNIADIEQLIRDIQ